MLYMHSWMSYETLADSWWSNNCCEATFRAYVRFSPVFGVLFPPVVSVAAPFKILKTLSLSFSLHESLYYLERQKTLVIDDTVQLRVNV